jgi:protein TonB
VVFASSTSPRGTIDAAAVPDEHPRRVHLRGEVMRARLKHSVEPAYPPIARKQRVEGTVKLQIIVGVDGTVKQVKVLSGPPLLTMAAVDAVRLWQYEPTSIKDQLVEVETNVDVVFSLKT